MCPKNSIKIECNKCVIQTLYSNGFQSYMVAFHFNRCAEEKSQYRSLKEEMFDTWKTEINTTDKIKFLCTSDD